MTSSLWPTIADFLAAHSTLVLATASDDGEPHATSLFYLFDLANPASIANSADSANRADSANPAPAANPAPRFYWLSAARSLHSRQLLRRPQVSIAIHATTSDWRQLHGVQMWGVARPIRERARRAPVLDLYRERFALGPVPALALRMSTLYCFQPSRLRWIDNRQRFAAKEEFRWEL